MGSSSIVDLSPDDEKVLGSQIYNRIIKSGVILDDAEATDYLRQKLAKIIKSGIKNNLITGTTIPMINDFDIFLIKNPMINAFALPGAKIGVHTGLFLNVRSEGELISVLSHELAHITQRHISRMFANRKESSALIMAAAILSAMAVSSSNPDAAMGLMTFGQGAAKKNDLIFSRQAEHEADRLGLKFLISGGFEPLEMVNMLETLNRQSLLSGQSASWFSTHPMNFERIAEVKSRILFENRQPRELDAGKGEVYRWIRARLKMSNEFFLADSFKTKKPSELSDSITKLENLYGYFWNCITNKNYEHARKVIFSLKNAVEVSTNKEKLLPMVMLAEGTLENELKNFSKSIEIIKKTLSLLEEHSSKRALLRLLIKNYIENNELLLAEETARTVLEKWPKDFWIWGQRAFISEKLGFRAKAHIYSAEKYVAMHEWYLAIEQLKIAKNQKNLDFISLSKIDTRLTEIMNIYKRNLKFSNR